MSVLYKGSCIYVVTHCQVALFSTFLPFLLMLSLCIVVCLSHLVSPSLLSFKFSQVNGVTLVDTRGQWGGEGHRHEGTYVVGRDETELAGVLEVHRLITQMIKD